MCRLAIIAAIVFNQSCNQVELYIIVDHFLYYSELITP